MRRGVFIAGTDTGVGKTWVASRLIEAIRRRGIDAVGSKPVECGGREDAEALLAAAGRSDLDLDAINPVSLAPPLAPAAAGGVELGRVLPALAALEGRSDFLLVEGAGGWLVPLDGTRTMADLAEALGLPVVVVAANRLGCLNHVLLTERAIRSSGLALAAVYLNTLPGQRDLSSESNPGVLRESLKGCPVVEDDVEALATMLLSHGAGEATGTSDKR